MNPQAEIATPYLARLYPIHKEMIKRLSRCALVPLPTKKIRKTKKKKTRISGSGIVRIALEEMSDKYKK